MGRRRERQKERGKDDVGRAREWNMGRARDAAEEGGRLREGNPPETRSVK